MARHRKRSSLLDRLILGTASIILGVGAILLLFFEFGGYLKGVL